MIFAKTQNSQTMMNDGGKTLLRHHSTPSTKDIRSDRFI